MRRRYIWNIGGRTLELGKRTLVMGVLNVTPDSFFDGGRFFDPTKAEIHGLRMLEEGADILDIGGESTRPNADRVSLEEEKRRVLPVLEAIKRERPDCVISVDTYKAEVAKAAVEAGAEIVNDVSALRWDAAMTRTLASLQCGVVLMHMRGRPEEWRKLSPLPDPTDLVKRELREWSDAAVAAGIARERIVVDPGFGFGKNFDENYPLLSRLNELEELGFPVLAGTSRKSFIGRTLESVGLPGGTDDRLTGSVAAMVESVLNGAQIVRVHDVAEARQAVAVVDEILKAKDISHEGHEGFTKDAT